MAKSTAMIPAEEVMINKIYFVRGYKVMLDKDLAALYGVRPIRLREQVKGTSNVFQRHLCFN